MLPATVERLAVVADASQAGLIHQELPRQGWAGVRIWIEPQGRNTAAAVSLAAYGGVPPGVYP